MTANITKRDVTKRDVLNLNDIRPMWNGFHGLHFSEGAEAGRYSGQKLGQMFGFNYKSDGRSVESVILPGSTDHDGYGVNVGIRWDDLPDGHDRPETRDDVYVTSETFGQGYYSEAVESGPVDQWGAAFNKAVLEARTAGKCWLCFHGETGIYYAHPVTKNSKGRTTIEIRMSDLPTGKSDPKTYTDLTQAVVAYLADPRCTERVRVAAELDRLGFWTTMRQDSDRREALHKLIGDNDFCNGGVRRFREHLGDLLPDPTPPLYPDRPDLTEARPVEMLVSDPNVSTEVWMRKVNEFLDKHRGESGTPLARFRIPVPDEN